MDTEATNTQSLKVLATTTPCIAKRPGLTTRRPPLQQERRGEETKQIGPENPLNEVSNTPSNSQAGRLHQFNSAWRDITEEPEVLDWVEHCHLEFVDDRRIAGTGT